MTITAPACTFDGFGKMAVEIASRLLDSGFPVQWRKTYSKERYKNKRAEFPQVLKGKTVQAAPKDDDELVFAPASQLHIPEGKRSFIYTGLTDPFVGRRIPAIQAEVLNKYEMVFVSNQTHADALAQGGVWRPIVVLQPGLNREIYRPHIGDHSELCTFGMTANPGEAGYVAFDNAITSWFEAFPGVKDVRLRIKVTPNFKVPPLKDDRIDVIYEYLPTNRLVEWYQSLDTFLSPGFSTGWNFQLHEAAACGATPISHTLGSQSHLNTDWAFPCECHVKDGKFKVRQDDLIDAMRFVHYDRLECTVRGKAFNQRTWGDMLQDIICAAAE